MPGTAPGRRAALGNFVVVTGSTLLGGLLNALLIALAARRGEISEIAAYTVMSAVLAVVAVLAGGGSSTMLYVSGTPAERQAVRSQRVLAVVPALVLTALVVSITYGAFGYTMLALVAAALAFIGNNVAELPLAQLYRDQQFVRIPVPFLLSKAAAVGVFLLGAPLTMALLLGAVSNLVGLELRAGENSPIRAMWNDRPTGPAARRAFRSGRSLYAYTLAELYTLKIPSIGLSLVTPVPVMGAFGAVAVVYQALLSVFQSGLYMVLSLRSRGRSGPDTGGPRRHDAEVLSLGAGILCAIVIGLAAPGLTADVLLLDLPQASTWLQILGAAVPFVLVNRIIATHAVGDGRSAVAARIAVSLAALTTVSLLIAVPLLGVIGGVLATLFGEAAVAGALLVLGLCSRIRRTESRRRGPG